METPCNPTLELVDIAAVVAASGAVPVMVDNTFATPALQNPLAHGAALVLHSATKYLGGHGDAMGGVVASNAAWAEAIRPVRAITGGLLHPLGAYLLHRGLPTLALRVRAQQATAGELATLLVEHPAVARVHYPGLPGADPRGLLGAQLRGPGAMLTLELEGGYAAAERFIGGLQLFTHAVSLGGVDSLVQHPASLTHRPVAPDARPGAGVVRLSIGLEAAADLWRDLESALAQASRG
jgi:methionine-gamma-lyase